MRAFWPPAEAAQADYEALRSAAVAGTPAVGPVAARFARSGLAGVIARPAAEAAFMATLVGGRRPPWSPYVDPRLEALADAFELLVVRDPRTDQHTEEAAR